MSTVNYVNPSTDQTVRIFDEFYNYDTTVSAEEYQIVYSYFETVFGTKEAAGNFSLILFKISEQSDIPVLSLLQEMQGQTKPELTLTLAYYLNGNRSKSTLLGLNNPVTPNFYVARNVRS
jgi:hypothetical protein